MKITELKVENYRGLKELTIPLSTFVCVTGENNAGKSSILQSLSLFLSGSGLKKSDYFDDTQAITISLTLSDITEADLTLLAEEHRGRIASIISNQSLTLVRRYELDGKSKLGYVGLIPIEPRFKEENISAMLSGKKGQALKDAVISDFPELSNQTSGLTSQKAAKELIQAIADGLPVTQKITGFLPLPTGLDNSVIPFLPEPIYVPAVKDLTDETKTAQTSPFGKILAIVLQAIEPLLASEKDLFDKLSQKLTRMTDTNGAIVDYRLTEIKEIENTLQRFVRESFSGVALEIEIPPPELKSILSTARIMADDGVRGPLELKGDGLRRAVVFSILRAYVELATKNSIQAPEAAMPTDRRYLLLFEEPELFLHPDAQKILFDALEIFSRKHYVVVTTHSPIFLGPGSTATFIRLSKNRAAGVNKPFAKAHHVDLSDINLKDEFQLICFENNSAAFFSKKIVLVEGDSDFIVFPHIAHKLNSDWNCRGQSIAFIRVGGKGSIARYRSFFNRFDVPVYIITDLDSIDDDFDKLSPSDEAKRLRTILFQNVQTVLAEEVVDAPRSKEIKKAQMSSDIRSLWENVRMIKAIYDRDKTKLPELDAAVEEFFSWEKKHARRECIRSASQSEVKNAKLALIDELRKQNTFVLERGSLEDYYPEDVMGSDKPSMAQSFQRVCDSREKILPICSQQIDTMSGVMTSEFEIIFSRIFME